MRESHQRRSREGVISHGLLEMRCDGGVSGSSEASRKLRPLPPLPTPRVHVPAGVPPHGTRAGRACSMRRSLVPLPLWLWTDAACSDADAERDRFTLHCFHECLALAPCYSFVWATWRRMAESLLTTGHHATRSHPRCFAVRDHCRRAIVLDLTGR